ncbi:MAG: glycerol-3-phosphate 1-O-acyltransferase PlsY [Silvibacterium sp.]|nr:glycerol-3-phosphate 1-O-acyltransferase PlsY [Silvibacterium sp.]MBV8436457.1 glycerol-3-phosphate 1-O-acyltransferase PlsY [Silvibacterium sp.]
MPVVAYLSIALAAYLLGSIPFGFLLVRIFRKEDIRSKGSGNIGATNVIRSGAKGLGALTFLLDACKGYAAVLLAGHVAVRIGVPYSNAVALAAIGAIVGHIYTVWLGFKGGKGVATAFGVFLALAPWAALASLGVFVLVFALSRYVSLASIVGAAAFPAFGLLLPHAAYGVWLTAVMMLAPIIVIAKHHENIGRLLHGTEYRFGKTKAAA